MAHIPGILNVESDQASRISKLRIERKLHESVFGYIQKYLDIYQTVDFLASAIIARHPQVLA